MRKRPREACKAAAGVALPAGTGQATLYGDSSGTGKPLGQAPTRISLPAGRHLVIVAPTSPRP